MIQNRRGRVVGMAGAALIASMLLSGGIAGAAPDTGSEGADDAIRGFTTPEFLQDEPQPLPLTRDGISAAAVVENQQISEQVRKITIASPALGRDVTVDVLLPADNSVPRPVLYMLDGVDAPDDYSKWMINGAPEFFADKNVNVVLVNGGEASMYTDWEQEDPELGWNQWETYLTQELPALIDAELGTSGVRGIAGNSMGAQAALMTVTRNPELYSAVAGFSGCYSASDPMGMLTTRSTVTARGGDPDNMWAPGGPAWEQHDSVVNAEALRGKTIYLSVGNGAVGRHEPNPTLSNVVAGGVLEGGANYCTRSMDARLGELGIPAVIDYEPEGIHAWGYWTDQLPKMWPTISAGLGL
ncbi:alpha/beta hydrolase [Tomitella biformata]|uniref:alpha/beta hydrolase n=1 Tax=Tomitella biformata TaxID=630403 RepID=UPI000467708F|nr:alpha/beta hydrolase family protein [Tomitella biformata]